MPSGPTIAHAPAAVQNDTQYDTPIDAKANPHQEPSEETRQAINKANSAPYTQDRVQGYHEFLPAQPAPIGSLLPVDKHPANEVVLKAGGAKLFEPLEIRGVVFPHRMWVAPMCMYSSDYGHATDHHFIWTGSMAQRGWQGIMLEATAVTPEGRISPEDAGLWCDSQIPPLKRQVDYVHALKGTIGIQLGHAGRKASVLAPWVRDRARADGCEGNLVGDEQGGWGDDVIAPSSIPYDPHSPLPGTLTLPQIQNLIQAFASAASRAKSAKFDYIEIHGAHGYLIHQFLSPLTNKRTDAYGGDLAGRTRFALEVTRAVRAVWGGPLFFRVSAEEWVRGVVGDERGEEREGVWRYWGLEQTTILARELHAAGVDLLDVSSGGNDPRQDIKPGPGYQVPLAAHLKAHLPPSLLISTVGQITSPTQAEAILQAGQADVIFFGRTVLRDIDFPIRAAKELGVGVWALRQFQSGWDWGSAKEEVGEEEEGAGEAKEAKSGE